MLLTLGHPNQSKKKASSGGLQWSTRASGDPESYMSFETFGYTQSTNTLKDNWNGFPSEILGQKHWNLSNMCSFSVLFWIFWLKNTLSHFYSKKKQQLNYAIPIYTTVSTHKKLKTIISFKTKIFAAMLLPPQSTTAHLFPPKSRKKPLHPFFHIRNGYTL